MTTAPDLATEPLADRTPARPDHVWPHHVRPIHIRPDPVRSTRVRSAAVRPGLRTALSLVLVAAGVAQGVSHPQVVRDALGTVADATGVHLPGRLPAPEDRDFPTPGVEAPARLLAAPLVPSSDATFAFNHTDTAPDGAAIPVSWSPCRPLTYVVDPAGAPPDFAERVRAVAHEVEAASGLVLADDGTTTEPATLPRAAFQHARYGDRWAPVLVRFADETATPALAGGVAGVAGQTMSTDPTTGTRHLVSGAVFLDTELLSWPDHDGEPAYLGTLRHEFGHLVGLGHVDDPTQLMHPVNQGQGAFQAGDLAGLAALGRGPCAPGL